MANLLRVPEHQQARICFCVERNMAHEAGFITEMVINKFPGTIGITQNPDNDYGWWTDHGQKIRYAMSLRQTFLENSIVYSDRLVCVNPFMEESRRMTATKAKFEEQLSRYKIIASDSQSAVSTPKFSVSGKTDKDGKISRSFNDDIVFAMSMACWMATSISANTLPNFPYDEGFVI